MTNSLQPVRQALGRILRGKDAVVDLALATFFSGGHLLLEGSPGTGKTRLAKGMAAIFGGSFKRLQMTSDLLPSDVVGVLRLNPDQHEFEFRPGPIFTHFLLADELNRTSPKTQSALLEAMAEGTVTVDGLTHRLPDPFFVVATQNPIESHGVYPLAESQLDRFTALVTVDAPEREAELEIYQDTRAQSEALPKLMDLEEVRAMRARVAQTHLEQSVLEYGLDLVRATRAPECHGVSVRGGLQFLEAGKALATLRGRDFVSPEDLRELAIPVLAHRVSRIDEEWDSAQKREWIESALQKVKAPR